MRQDPQAHCLKMTGMHFKVLQNMSSLQVINLIYRLLGSLVWATALYVSKRKHSAPQRALGFPSPSRAHTHYINTMELNAFFYHENMFLLLCTTNRKRMSHVCGQNQLPLQGVFTVIPASICIQFAKLNVVLILLCLQWRFSMLDTYFYMKIKFPMCWFRSCFLLWRTQRSQ